LEGFPATALARAAESESVATTIFMKVLFIGGTGVISTACGQLAIEHGVELTLLTRGRSSRPAPDGARHIHADIGDLQAVRRALANARFDVVVHWVAFAPQDIESAISLFQGRTDQFVFISSASVYQKPPAHLPVTESAPLANPFWSYARAKIACEERLVRAWLEGRFPITIVRPSHTYDQTKLPLRGGYTMIDRMRRGSPVIVPGDGTSLWTLTHHRDFAGGFVPLLGNLQTLGMAFHITSDENLTWNQIYAIMGSAAGVQEVARQFVHVPSDLIAALDPEWGASLLGDKAHSMVFDSSKVRRFVPGFRPVVPFRQGAAEIISWHDGDPARRQRDARQDLRFDAILNAMNSAWDFVRS
jgi:nucleoside-diphosphate-sugar epimerase